MKLMEKPRPWNVTPAVMMGIAERGGWFAAMTEAMVPLSMTGKAGRIQDGIIVCRPYECEEKTKEYWMTATRRVQAQ